MLVQTLFEEETYIYMDAVPTISHKKEFKKCRQKKAHSHGKDSCCSFGNERKQKTKREELLLITMGPPSQGVHLKEGKKEKKSTFLFYCSKEEVSRTSIH